MRFGDTSWLSDYVVNYRKQHNEGRSKMKLTTEQKNKVKKFIKRLTESNYNSLEFIGSDVDEMLDAINLLNGANLSGHRGIFKFRDLVKITPEDTTGHIINKNKYSVMVFLTNKSNSIIKETEYIQAANVFLSKNGFNCKLYKTT